MIIEHKKLTNLINVGVILVDSDLNVKYWNNWIKIQTQKQYKDFIDKSLNFIFDIEPLHVKTLKRLINTTLILNSPSFFTADTKNYLIPIKNKLYITSRNIKYMQQDVTILPYDTDEKIVAILIYDQTPLIASRQCIEIKNKELAQLNDNANITINELKKAQDKLKEQKDIIYNQARYDQLTKLSNRMYLTEKAEIAIKDSKRINKKMAILFIDLDKFKLVNDTMGHDAGDELLVEVAKVLKDNTRETDIVSRLGGDEFLILLKHIEDEEDAGHVANKILKAIYYNEKIRSYTPQVTASIGISIYPENGENLSQLMKTADIALYEAKDKGRNNFQFFAKEMNEEIHNNIHMEQDMKKSLKSNDFELYFQPKFDSKNLTIKSAEALIRWNHPTKKMIMPNDFIPLAEKNGFIKELGKWVINESFKKIVSWEKKGLIPIKLSINLSVKQFEDPNLLIFVKELLEKTQINPSQIEFEVTESVALYNMQKNVSLLQELQKMGIGIALDDFGTGYSSLSYVKNLPINTLKIDKSFMAEVPINTTSNALAKMIIELANELNLQVVAEGIETDTQKDFLDTLECTHYQGFLFAKPMPSLKFEELLKSNK